MLGYAFPGQGSQYSGMGKVLLERYPEADETFKLAESITGLPLSKLLIEASDEELKDTINTQPAIFLHSVALYRILKERRPPQVVFGHSLGEFAALYAAGVFDFATALNLVIERGRIMGKAGRGKMLAVIGSNAQTIAEEVLSEGSFPNTVIANYNSPKQVVLSGTADEIETIHTLLKEMVRSRGIRLRLVPLKVGAAFHSPLMEGAAEEFGRILEKVRFREPHIPVIMNSTGQAATTSQEIKRALMVQMRSPVLFVDMVREAMRMGVDYVLEVGPGRVLCGLIHQITDRISCQPTDPKYAP
ncbi:MAG: ACP S-malonyltransferase [Thermotogae bacterium]|nr:ACP S-malonyltransferase [Thermotogota bacterium]